MSSNSNSAASKYRYNGKEIQEELGLNMYDYGARFYDPATARWFTPDALAEKYYDTSTYTYALNNPVLFVDPDGNQVEMCCKELLNTLKRWQSQGSAMTTSTSKAVDNFTAPARNATQNASNVVTEVSQASSEMRSSAINSHVETSKGLYNLQAMMGGSGLGLTTGMRVTATTKAIKTAETAANNIEETVVVMGQGMDRVKDAAKALKTNGIESVEIFKPTTEAVEAFENLLGGLAKGERLSDDVVKSTQLFKENQAWIKGVQESGKTILDIGGNGSGKTSTFYEMEKLTVYGSQ